MALALVIQLGLVACEQPSRPIEPQAHHTFPDLAPRRPERLVVDLPREEMALIRVEGFEAAVKSSVMDADDTLLSAAQLPYRRIGPVFQIIDTRVSDGPFQIVIEPLELSQNARLEATVYALPQASKRDRARIQAYKAYEAATQASDKESPELWRERASLFHSAAAGFKRAGDTEEQLWAEYLGAYVHYFPLAEYDHTAQAAAEIQARARKLGFREIELMATQLEGQALIERDEADTPETARDKAERGLAVLQRAVELAGEMDYRYEQAWALNSLGIGFFYQDRYAKAERQYEQALDIALDIQDTRLPSQVRANLALVQERQGDLRGALAALLAINVQLQEDGPTADLAHNWSELSRLYERLYLFRESIAAQKRALELWRELNSAEGKGRSGLSLAHAYQAIGNRQTALMVLRESIKDMEAAGYARGLREGFGLLAELHRGSGQYDEMARARERQADYLNSVAHQARHRYEKGLDALAQFPQDPARAAPWFAEAMNLADDAGSSGLALRARLRLCTIVGPESEREFCTVAQLDSALEAWLPLAPPSQAFEARYLLAVRLADLGRTQEARQTVDRLIDDIQFYRNTLPGVLGAWYWQGRARIFDLFMRLALYEDEAGTNRPARSLLAFNRLLNTSLGAGPASSPPPADSGRLETLRGLLARLDSGDATEGPKLRQAIDRQLLALGHRPGESGREFGEKDLQSKLQRLPADSALLAYYLAPGEAWLWVADRQGIRIEPLSGASDVEEALDHARSGMRVVGNVRLDGDLERVGDLLLEPVGEDLPETVYLLVAGQFAGFPLDAVRNDGRYFGQDHAVINILSLEGLDHAGQLPGDAGSWQSLLLAGDPVRVADGNSALPAASRELEGLAGLMNGKSIIRRSGRDLTLDVVHSQPFKSADLIHLSSHASINLEYPELSRLMLSPSGRDDAYLTPLEIRGLTTRADLVVLSACETTGVNRFSFDSNLGFVHAFLAAGAGGVVATLWPVSDRFAADFMLDFYAAMLKGANAPLALAQVKRRYMLNAPASGKLDWSAFQIYIN